MYLDSRTFEIITNMRDIRIQSPLIEVDDFIGPIISILNKKGYTTRYCCSGHLKSYFNNGESEGFQCYIMFDSSIYIKYFNYIPKGFSINTNRYKTEKRLILEKYYCINETVEERFSNILTTMNDLHEWACSLPIIIKI